eukprot:759533_1
MSIFLFVVLHPFHISKNGRWSPYCNGHHKLCTNNNCNDCLQKSFASHEKSKYWSKKNKKQPRDVCKYARDKYWFDCDECNHSFHSVLNSISHGTWCPSCKPPWSKKHVIGLIMYKQKNNVPLYMVEIMDKNIKSQ